MERRIHDMLAAIEREDDVRIVYACESGSRAWGFASPDSDWDVRFIYVRRPNEYFSIDLEDRRDVIERPIVDLLDVNGWDLRKALRLMRKSNPPLLEWLRSPIVYSERCATRDALGTLLATWYSPSACRNHYLSMAKGNYREYLQDETVWTKKYLYVLRPLLAVRWIEADIGPAPTEFHVMIERVVVDARIRHAIDELLERKRTGEELARGPRIPVLNEFIDAELTRAESATLANPAASIDSAHMNAVFRDLVRRAWEE